MGNAAGVVEANIKEKYVIRQKKLGQGTFGQVHKGVRKADKKSCAIKIMHKKHILAKASLTEKLKREVIIMKQCDHVNIVQFYDVFVDRRYVYICIEYCAGGDLLEYLNERGRPIRENMVAHYMKQCLRGLDYLHSKGIAHRDIKPENILLNADRQICKLADFGLSHQSEDPNAKFHTQCGSITHIAPEVFSGKGYSKGVDIWSLGVVLFVMLSVSYPFNDVDKNKIIAQIHKADVASKFDADPIWQNVSLNAKDLIQLMLMTDPRRRLSITHCLNHPFINKGKKKVKAKANNRLVNQFAKVAPLAKSSARALNAENPLADEELQRIGVEKMHEEETEPQRLNPDEVAEEEIQSA